MDRSGNVLMTFPNWLDVTYQDENFLPVRLANGGWQPGTLDHLRDELMASKAVTVNTATGNTWFQVDLGTTREIKTVAIPDSNMSRRAKVRVQVAAYNDPEFGAPLADTGWREVWNVVYPLRTLPSTHPSFADGKLTEEDRAKPGMKMPWFHIFPTAILGQHVRVFFDDTGNKAGFIALPRLFIAGGWQAPINFKLGRGIGYEFNTTAVQSLGGALFHEIRTPGRVVVGELDFLDEEEAYAFVLQMQRDLQDAKQLFISIDPLTDSRRHLNSFLCRIRQCTPLEAVALGVVKTGFVFKEVL